jgi:hypothetical protein
MQYTEKDVAKLVADVEKAFTAHLAKAESDVLAKSEDGEKDHEDKKEHEEKPEHKEKPEHEAKEHHEEGEKHAEHESEGEKKPEGHEEHEGHDYDQEDMMHMEKMYRSMSKGEMQAHHECLSKCMGKAEAKPAEMTKNEAEGHKNGGEMSACEPKDGPGAKSPASKADGEQMEKSENQEVELLKSELNAQKKNFEAFQELLTKLVKKTAPQGKAITSLDVIAKSEMPNEEKAISKKEIHEILTAKTADPSLKKSDRDAVNSYYLNGQVNVNSISHLLK